MVNGAKIRLRSTNKEIKKIYKEKLEKVDGLKVRLGNIA